MSIARRQVGKVTIFDVSGSLQGGPESKELKDEVAAVLAGGGDRVLLNLAEVEWVNSSGVGTLFACHISSGQRGAKTALLNVPEKILDILRVTHLDRVFEIHSDEEVAVQRLSG